MSPRSLHLLSPPSRAKVVYDDGAEEEVSFPEPTIRFVRGGGGSEATTTTKKRKAAPAPAHSPSAAAPPQHHQDITKTTPKAKHNPSPSPIPGPSPSLRPLTSKKKAVSEAGDKTVTAGQCDKKLWSADYRIEAPSQLPTRLNVLETFAGAGGLHMSGSARFGDVEVTIQSVAAIDIVEDPCDTYKHNFPEVNVMHIGISRFVATGRRLQALKEGKASTPAALKGSAIDAVINFRITEEAGRRREEDIIRVKGRNNKAGSTTDKQFSDEVTSLEITGRKPIPWIEWLVTRVDGGSGWTPDCDDVHLTAAVRAYVNSSSFGAHKFPLPGDIQVVTGGPPCQGWSGYNTTRPTSNQVSELMEHPENRLICRFMELCWFYKPLYVLMEEVPDVVRRGNKGKKSKIKKEVNTKTKTNRNE